MSKIKAAELIKKRRGQKQPRKKRKGRGERGLLAHASNEVAGERNEKKIQKNQK